jgi:hypothetical protein
MAVEVVRALDLILHLQVEMLELEAAELVVE